MSNQASIEVHNLTVVYHRKPVLWNIDFELPQGKMIGIMGPNGAGKSTLFKAILGLVPLNSGYAKIYNSSINEVRKRVSYIPQRQSIDWDFPATVRDVVSMGRFQKRGLFGRINATDKNVIEESLEKVGMTTFAKRQISQLSGGQQQRVFLARALAQETDLYLLDEPFAGVDASTEESLVNMLKELVKNGKTVVVVHHDLHTASDYFDWIVLLNSSLIGAGPMQEVFTQEKLKATYSGKLTVLSQVGDQLREKNFPVREKQ